MFADKLTGKYVQTEKADKLPNLTWWGQSLDFSLYLFFFDVIGLTMGLYQEILL
jgi:hypothetical protein